MRSFWRSATCLLLAFAVFAILVSPLVPSVPTALRAKQAAHAFQFAIASARAAVSGRLATVHPQQQAAEEFAGPHSGRDVVDLTAARLC